MHDVSNNITSSKILIHACCAVCAFYTIEKLKRSFSEVALFFYNPNIHPKEEYEKRLAAIQKVADIYQCAFYAGPYEPEKWHSHVKGFEREQEGGARCPLCYFMRLNETAKKAKGFGCEYFATTLSISPHKKAAMINEIGITCAEKYGVLFWEDDFKKQDGFKKTNELAKKYDIYRQNYCGCVFSLGPKKQTQI